LIAYNEYDRVMRLLERLEKKSLVNEKQKCSPSSLMGSQTPRFREGRKEMLDSSPPNPLHGHCPAWLQGELTLRKNILGILHKIAVRGINLVQFYFNFLILVVN